MHLFKKWNKQASDLLSLSLRHDPKPSHQLMPSTVADYTRMFFFRKWKSSWRN